MKLLISELRLRWVSLLMWGLSVAALVGLVLAFYPQVKNNQSLNSLYADMSPEVRALLGGSDLTSPAGYLNTQLFAFVLPAVLLVFGIGRGAAALAGEEEARTLDLLLAQPLGRRSTYLQKAGALAVSIAGLTATAWVILVALNSPARLHLPVSDLRLVVCKWACSRSRFPSPPRRLPPRQPTAHIRPGLARGGPSGRRRRRGRGQRRLPLRAPRPARLSRPSASASTVS